MRVSTLLSDFLGIAMVWLLSSRKHISHASSVSTNQPPSVKFQKMTPKETFFYFRQNGPAKPIVSTYARVRRSLKKNLYISKTFGAVMQSAINQQIGGLSQERFGASGIASRSLTSSFVPNCQSFMQRANRCIVNSSGQLQIVHQSSYLGLKKLC